MRSGNPDEPATAEVVNEASVWLAGGGIVTMALAPLALPFLILTLVFVLPLLLLPLVPLLVVALIAFPVVLAVRLGRRVSAARRPARGRGHSPRTWRADRHIAD